MRTIETKVFTFDELNQKARETAIEQIRNSYYENNNFAEWAVDDCALLEPRHKELEDLFGSDYKLPLLKNNRRVYYSLDRNRHIDISNAMEVQNDSQFLEWLGINLTDFKNDEGYLMLDYRIGEDTIEFDSNDWDYEFTDEQENILKDAKEKFENHCEVILNRIETDYNYRFTDEAILEDIQANEWEFLENGERF